MTSTSDLALEPNVSCSTSAPSATRQVTTNGRAMVPVDIAQPALHPQLQEQMFKPVTPIKYQVLDKLLQDHPNREMVEYIVNGFQFGFSLKYKGPLENRQP